MPNFDGTGPQGNGAMTGRKMGRCAGNSENRIGFGRARGRGQGRGFRRLFSNSRTVQDLEAYQEDLRAELKAVENELKESK